jgi:hypothetical protein
MAAMFISIQLVTKRSEAGGGTGWQNFCPSGVQRMTVHTL